MRTSSILTLEVYTFVNAMHSRSYLILDITEARCVWDVLVTLCNLRVWIFADIIGHIPVHGILIHTFPAQGYGYSMPWWHWSSCNIWRTCPLYLIGRINWSQSISLWLVSWCSIHFLNISLLNWRRYFLTEFYIILVLTYVFNFSTNLIDWQT